jgi:hypothetical protein
MQLRTIVSALVAATAIGWPVVGEEPSASQKVSQPDPTKVYFLDPLADGIRVIPVEKCKPHHVYFRYSQRLGRHVWSKTDANRVFRYAIGPGSTVPVWMFDLEIDPEVGRRALEERAPDVAKRMMIEGTTPSLRLNQEGKWRVDPSSNGGRIFDLETGERWEWHGNHRMPVLHTGGNTWTWDGRWYVPARGLTHGFTGDSMRLELILE